MANEERTALDAVMNYLDSYSKKGVEGCMAAMAGSRP